MFPFNKNNIGKRDEFFTPLLRNFFDDDFFLKMDGLQGNFKVDLKENETCYVVEADLPGIKKEFIDINIENNYLIISAKRDDINEEKNENFIRRERHYGEFRRSFYIDDIDEKNIKASFNDGVLKITLQKLINGDNKKKKIDII